MNAKTFAQRIMSDPLYRQSVVTRAQAGTLPPDVEVLLLELADARTPASADLEPLRPVKSTALKLV